MMKPHLSHCLPIILAFAMATAATAQLDTITPWSPMFETPLRSSISVATVDMLVSELRLSEAQENAVRHAFDEHRAAFAAFVNEHRTVVQEAEQAVRETRHASIERVEMLAEREERLAPIADEQAELDQRFFVEVMALLTKDQLERWERFERRHERERFLRGCRTFPYEGNDQMALLKELLDEDSLDLGDWLAEHPKIAQVLLAYELAIAVPLREWVKLDIHGSRHWDRRMAARAQVGADGRTYIGDHPSQQAKVQDERELRRMSQLRRELARVNRDYHRILTAALPVDLSLRLDQANVAAALCSARIEQRNLPAREFVEEVLERDDLTAVQRRAVEGRPLAYEHAVPELNRRAIHARDAYAAAVSPGSRDRDKRRVLEDEWKRMVNNRLEVERKLIADVYALLTPEQQSEVDVPQVPEPRY